MGRSLRVLFVEDQEKDVELLARELRRGGYDLVPDRVDTPEGFTAALDRQEWDLILCDYRMPRFSTVTALAMTKERKVDIPFIVVSGTIGEETAVEALRAGAHDFMSKDHLTRLLPAIDRELREAASRAERRKLELQYHQAQKLEAVGHFAGGIAHDFNNLLTVISGYVELAILRLPEGDTTRRHLTEVREASERAATLVRQIASFSRQQVVEHRVFDLNTVMARMDRLLLRVLGEDIDFDMDLDAKSAWILGDPGQTEQVLMNLVVNARDAMPNGGRLQIGTAAEELDEGDPHCALGLHPGPHVLLTVSDDGTGMDAETMAHAFEPFFTTKAEGKGTGLGLATVHGIVQRCGGAVFISSEPGLGTTFRIYFPAAEAGEEASGLPRDAGKAVGGSEIILVVEDDAQIRGLATHVLRDNGYRVFEVANPAEALALSGKVTCPINLMLTDVALLGMSGPDLATRLASTRPAMKVLFISGYAVGGDGRHSIPRVGARFLPKPFTPDPLLRSVREALDAPMAACAG